MKSGTVKPARIARSAEPGRRSRTNEVGPLALQGVRREFGRIQALAGIDLTVGEGEFVAMLGPSGCGKTTALNCIAGLVPLSDGTIHLGERRIDRLKPEERGFGMVFQSYALFPHMSVRGNVGFGLNLRNVPRAEISRRVDDALALVRLGSQADKLPGEMSGGQQQRVAIARAIVIEPPLVLMDEPLSNLDAQLRLEMRVEIRRIHEAIGSTTIYVTHDQDEALSMADRVVVMMDGLIRQSGTPEDLYERPCDPEVADFMGFRNRLTGRVVASEGARVMVAAAGATFAAVPRGPVEPGAEAIVSIRPEDFVAGDEPSGVAARVLAVEYRGRAFFGTAAAVADGTPLFFRAERPVARGDALRLSAAPGRTLCFPVSASGARPLS
jgi:putative spermidine/putrescine transport system ATP-binding protein